MPDIVIEKCSSLDSIIDLFNEHQDYPFTHLADIHLFNMLNHLKTFKAFTAKVDDKVVGCIYAMRYMYNCGWIGGLLVHKNFRKIGIGGRLLKKALRFLKCRYVYLFVEPENVVAKRLYENAGFNAVYRRLNYVVHVPLEGLNGDQDISYDVTWNDLTAAIGFRERNGIVNIGYYPVKIKKKVYDDWKTEGKVLRCGSLLAIIENSCNVNVNSYTFTFNNYILKGLHVQTKERIVEVNPFYTRNQPSDLIKLINTLSQGRKVAVWTYQEDPVATRLPLKWAPAALVMQLYRR